MHSRVARFVAACLAILGLLFSQVALAAYACPMDMAAATQSAAESDCCPDAASAAAGLCAEHCKDSRAAVPDVTPPPSDFVPAFTVTLALPPAAGFTGFEFSPPFSHATSPPLSILNCCFRI